MEVGAGSVITGHVAGGGGMLDLMQGTTGVLSGLGDAAGGTVTSGSDTWSFSGFPSLAIRNGASWALAGANTLNTRAGVTVGGALTARGALTVDGGGTLGLTNNLSSLVALNGLTLANATLTPAGGAIEVGNAGGAAIGAVTVDAGNGLTGNGTVNSAVVDNGTVTAQGGTLALLHGMSGSGNAVISGGAVLFSAKSLGEAGVAFASGNARLALGAGATVSAVVSGFGSGDTIDVQNKALTSLTYNNGVLKLYDALHVQQLRLVLTGSFAQNNFLLTSDGHGGTNITTTGLAISQHSTTTWVPHAPHHP